jgi:lysophospholipase L1-like esterase
MIYGLGACLVLAAWLGCQGQTPAGTSSPSSSPMSERTDSSLSLNDPRLRWWGRFVEAEDGSRRSAWTAAQLVFRCEAPRLELQMGHESLPAEPSPWPLYVQVQIDQLPPDTIALPPQAPGVWWTLADSLSPGPHLVRITKRSEAMTGVWRVEGLRLDDKGKLLPPPPLPNHYLLAIGNSITCGYGNLATEAECDFSAALEDGTQSYAALAARQMGAAYAAICYSGRGVWRNYDGSQTGTLPQLVREGLIGDSLALSSSSPAPDAVIINLGTNDFALGIPDQAGFVGAYLALARLLRQQYPQAALILGTSPMLLGDRRRLQRAYLDHVQAELKAAGFERVYRLDFSTQGRVGYGCNWHPNLAQHRKNGEELATFLQNQLGWEQPVNKTAQD